LGIELLGQRILIAKNYLRVVLIHVLVVLSAIVSCYFSLSGWPVVAHGNIVCACSMRPDRAYVLLFGVSVTVGVWLHVSLLMIDDLRLLHFVVVDHSETLIQRVLTVPSDILVNLCFVRVSSPEPFRTLELSLCFGGTRGLFSPPVWVDLGV
jgi:hypothetical protein